MQDGKFCNAEKYLFFLDIKNITLFLAAVPIISTQTYTHTNNFHTIKPEMESITSIKIKSKQKVINEN